MSLTFVIDKIPLFGILCQSSFWSLFLGFIILGVSFLCRINLDNHVFLVSFVDLLKTKFTISLRELRVDHRFLLLCASGSVMVSKLDLQTYTSEFKSHWVPHSYGLVPHLSKKLSKLPPLPPLRWIAFVSTRIFFCWAYGGFSTSSDPSQQLPLSAKSPIILLVDLRLNFILKGTAYQNHK